MSYECHFSFEVKGMKRDVELFVKKLPEIGLKIDGWYYKYSKGFELKSAEDKVEFYFHESGNHLDRCFDFDIADSSSYSKMVALVPQLEISGEFGDEYGSGFEFLSHAGSDSCNVEYIEDEGQIRLVIFVKSKELNKINKKIEEIISFSKNSIVSSVGSPYGELIEGEMLFFSSIEENRLDEMDCIENDLENAFYEYKQIYLKLCNAIPDTEIKMYVDHIACDAGYFDDSSIFLFKDSDETFCMDGGEDGFWIDLDEDPETIIENFDTIISENEDSWEPIEDEDNEDEDDFGDEDEEDEDDEEGIIFDDIDEIDFEGSVFVLSGDFEFGSKSQVTEQITDLGGTVTGSVSGKTNYLVIGNKESANWTNGAAGGKKVEKALELKEKGSSIYILSEDSLVEYFD